MPDNVRIVGDGNFGSTAYWTAALASNQDLRINKGAEDFNAGLNHAGKDFLSLWVAEGYGDESTQFGTPSSPLECNINQSGAGVFDFAGRCANFYARGGSGTARWATVQWRPRNNQARFLPAAVDFTTCRLVRGVALLPDTVTIGSGGLWVYDGAHTVEPHASNAPDIVALGGTLNLRRDFASLKVQGRARVVIELDPGVTGGTVDIESADAQVVLIRGDLGAVSVRAGTLDKSRLAAAAACSSQTWHPTSTEIRERGAELLTGTRTNIAGGPRVV